MKGHLKQRSKGPWTIWLDIGRDPETGKRKQQTLTVRGTKKDAERELRGVLARIEGGGYVKPTKLTLAQFLEEWLRDYVELNCSPRTRASYEMIVRHHIIPELGWF